ncbi:ATP-dependent DNA helicase [Intestinicryptomonas porci]|uniref:ATP-dependent DNA helicase n=1 Tax=Intestinicryptomonas porci TaxID=2926320 RepID=A0ABU4WIU2_9BACT|nr:ATP-dependent DNA helicase [Opitutales bacterium CLA-KB-P66]
MYSPDVKQPLFLSETSDAIFKAGGAMQEYLGFEHRPEQEEMSRFCAQAFESDTPLVFEAGTGVGKSLAYLIPGIIAAKRTRRPLIVSTNTIALQQQILNKDLPLVKLLFTRDETLREFADFKTAFLVGRANYLCTTRLRRAIAEKTELFETKEAAELERIREWALTTETGLYEELNPPPMPEVWGWVNADSSSCTLKNCSDGLCFYQKAKKKIAGADVVIVNHSLLFSLIASGAASEIGSKGVLFSNDMCVLDEAHLIHDVAAENFGLSISSRALNRELKRIYDPRKKRGLIMRGGLAREIEKDVVADAIRESEEFFASVRQKYLTKRDTVSLSSPEWIENTLDKPLEILAQTLASLASRAQSEQAASEIKDYQRRIIAARNALQDAVFLSSRDHVYWVEKSGSSENVSIQSAPIDVAPILREVLFERETSVILTSATLATSKGNLDSFIEKTGAEAAEKFVANSPFDYKKNMRVMLCNDAPEPDKDSKKLDCENIAKIIERLCAGVEGGTLVLFTGYYEMNKTADFLYESNILKDRRILVQKQMPRAELIARFKEHGNAVLLGTDSFWTGIDVPGKALSQVIITRLPFANPSHPLVEARNNKILSEGGKPFIQLSIPEAIIKFRQGVGRLIRSKTDKGIISLLDSRLVSKPYGRNFMAALPPAPVLRFNSGNLELQLKTALNELKI